MWNIDFRHSPAQSRSNRLPSPPFLPITHISYMDYMPRWYFFWHSHAHSMEVVVVVHGHGWLNLGNERLALKRGSVAVVPRGTLHYYSQDGEEEFLYYCMGFLADDETNPLMQRFRALNCTVINDEKNGGYAEETCRMLENQMAVNGGVADEVVQSACYALLLRILDQASRSGHMAATSQFMLNDVLIYISQHYMEDITLTVLSKMFGISPVHLNRLFHKNCGMSPMNYVSYYRITKAVILLQQTDLSVTEITERIGYQNQAHFTKLFRERIGFTPSEFRQRSREEKQRIVG